MTADSNTLTKASINNPEFQQLPDSVLRALNVWLGLSETERTELTGAIDLIGTLPYDVVSDIIINVKTGPYNIPCSYCGRG
jgi:hypothetical protein